MSIDRSITEISKKLQKTGRSGAESLEVLNEQPQKTIPQGRGFANELAEDRSLKLKSAEFEQLPTDHFKSTNCRDCPEGMEW